MDTEVIDCSKSINKPGIDRAAELLKAGKLVVIPTETVYGLAANALNAESVAEIFKAKGRPQDNPLIVHVASQEWLPKYTLEIPEAARKLMDAFWPGPLTIILKKSPVIPDIVSAGLDTAAFRCPSNPIAHAIIEASGIPLAAPSANLSGKPSPTTASYVLQDLKGRVSAVVDGGPCDVGVESTVITLCDGCPRVLRPGGITPEQLKSVLGSVEIDRAVTHKVNSDERVASPGMKYKHYAPKANVIIIKGGTDKMAAYVNERAADGVAALCFKEEADRFNVPCVTYGSKKDSLSQAQRLFDALRELDEIGAKTVYASCPETTGVGLAVYNRLIRAAGFDIIEL
jgi:L-threonylcarbamoyladenylate synthase